MTIPRDDVYTNTKELSAYELYLIDEGYITKEWAEKRAALWHDIETTFSKAVCSYKWELYDENDNYIGFITDYLYHVEKLTHYNHDYLVDCIWSIYDELLEDFNTFTEEGSKQFHREFLDNIASLLFSALELDLC